MPTNPFSVSEIEQMRALVDKALRITSPEMAMASQSDWESANKARRVFAKACSPTTVARMLDEIERLTALLSVASIECPDCVEGYTRDADDMYDNCGTCATSGRVPALSSGTPQ